MLQEDGSLTISDYESANTLNKFFTSVYTKEPTIDIPSLSDRSNGCKLQSISLTHQDVLNQLNRLKTNKSCGPDNVHSRVIKEVKDGLTVPLYYIFRKSLEEAVLPMSWKQATVTAIYKKGDKKLPNNYRPISLTSIFCRMLESIIRDKIMSYFTSNNLFCNEQHGFRSQRSCETQLLSIMEHWTKIIDDGNDIDVVYLDFQKAFDKVPHKRLLAKLKAYGLQGNILDWISNFLSNRLQRVVVRRTYSEWSKVISGVPQGSVLGPTLFIIYVNDLPDCINSFVGIFADDTKIYRPISCLNDSVVLQQDINSLSKWCDVWLSFLNFSKCKHVSFGSSTSFTGRQYYFYSDRDTYQISAVESERDLGIIFNNSLQFKSHINEIIHKANNILGIIKRTFRSRDANTIRLLYTTLVRPILDYASTIWNPYLMGDIRNLEKIQRRATKLISSLHNLSYYQRLQQLNLPSLLYRRTRMDLIMTYKILHDMVSLNKNNFFTINTNPTRSNGLKIYKHRCNTTIRRTSFSQRVINDWNLLPHNVVTAPNVFIFKTELDNFLCNRRFNYI